MRERVGVVSANISVIKKNRLHNRLILKITNTLISKVGLDFGVECILEKKGF